MKNKLLCFKKRKTHAETKRNSYISFLVVSLFSFFGYSQLATEAFESGVPTDWTLIENDVATTSWGATTDGYLSTNAVYVDPSSDNIGDQNTAEYFLVTPSVTVPENGLIHFYSKQATEADNGASYQIRLSTASQPDINGFSVVLDSWTETTLNVGDQTEYEEKTVEIPETIPSGLAIYIAFVVVNTQEGATATGDAWYVDDVAVLEGCAALDEGSVTIDNITPQGADVHWEYDSATGFEIQVVAAGETPETSGTETALTDYTLTALEADTAYDVYMKTTCANGTNSIWAGPFSFTTGVLGLSCDAPIVLPDILGGTSYELDDNLNNYVNTDVTYDTQGSGCFSGTTNYLNGDKIFFEYTPTEDGLITISSETPGYMSGGGGNNCYNSNTTIVVYQGCANVGVNCLAGANTTSSSLSASIDNFLVEANETYIIVLSSSLNSNAGICFTFSVEGSACAAPSGITYDSLTDTSASFSWDNVGGFASSWEYAAVATGAAAPTSGTTTTSNEGNLVEGLTAGETYDLYVRSECNGTDGDWGTPFTFTTQCSVFETPYFEDFNSGTASAPVECWYVFNENGGQAWSYLSGNATLYVGTANGSNDDYFISPQINISGEQKRLRFQYRSLGGITPFEILVSDTGVGLDDFDTVLLAEQSFNSGGDYVEMIVEIPETITGAVNFAWHVAPNEAETGTRLYINDVYVEDIPACPSPILPEVTTVGTTTTTVSWTQGGSETEWEIVVQDEGTGTPAADAETIVADSNPFTIEALDPAHQYEFYVRAYCNDEEQSEWVGPVSFITDCATFETPFYESFDDTDPNTQKFCWTTNNNNADNFQWSIGTQNTQIQDSPFFFGAQGFDDWLISPAINVEGTKQLRFSYRTPFSFFFTTQRFGLEVLMSTTDTNLDSFEVIQPLFEVANANYEEMSLYINADGPVYIAFRVPPSFDLTDGASILNIDDVYIEDAPACPDPSALAVANVTATSADLSWIQGFQEEEWSVVIQPAGSGVPTAATDTAIEESYAATDLEPGTAYEAYIQADCGDGDVSSWIGPITFNTLCDEVFTTPFIETFEVDSASENCWIVVNDNNDGYTWTVDNSMLPYEGEEAAGMFTGTNGENEDWLISPAITIEANQRLKYYYRVHDSSYTEDLEVLLSTTGVELEDFTTVLYDSDDDTVIINNTEYLEKVINLPEGITGDVHIAFHVPYYNSTMPYRGQVLLVDNVVIEDIPACAAPSNIAISAITDTQFEVAWDANGDEAAWEIAVIPADEEVDMEAIPAEYLYDAATNPFTISELTAASMYYVYVRAVCGEDAVSEWSGPTEVTTMCSFDNLCEYTIILTSDSSSSSTIQVMQNQQMVQELVFTGDEEGESYSLFLCTGAEYSLYFDTVGNAGYQYEDYVVEVQDYQGNTVWANTESIIPETTIYAGIASCGEVACPQPTDLTVSEIQEFSWTAGGDETQWEVAVQPIANGTIPQSGTLVDTNTYTPTATDFSDANAATYEYFVRAVCGDDSSSFWSGPFEFVRNDDTTTALTLPINEGEDCETVMTDVSFHNASVSDQAVACETDNNADVWFTFNATANVHIIKASGFTGNFYYNTGEEAYPDMMMTLYHVAEDGSLEEVTCSNNNVIVAAYASELVVGDDYMVRMILRNPEVSTRRFNVCVTTPTELCAMDVFNGDFEEPALQYLNVTYSIISQYVVPGWRMNNETELGNSMFIWNAFTAPSAGLSPYSGSQFIQLLTDTAEYYEEVDENGNIDEASGLYNDFDTSEITKYDYSFAHQARNDGNTVQLLAGPPEGPFTLLEEQVGVVGSWTLHTGSYDVPEGQTTTRFIFRTKNYQGNNLLDAISFVPDNSIITADQDLACTDGALSLEANGTGVWSSVAENPSEVTFTDANSATTTATGFAVSGTYDLIWTTSYCEEIVTITYTGVDEIPSVMSPIDYCQGATPEALMATELEGYTLVWFTSETAEGTTEAPVPSTTELGETTYYVAYENAEGCRGDMAAITVVVNELSTPTTAFSYLEDAYCISDASELPQYDADFSYGGTFTAEDGLAIDADTGEIDFVNSAAGTYTVTYTIAEDLETCLHEGSSSVTITITEEPAYSIEDSCDGQDMMLELFSETTPFDTDVTFEWTNTEGTVIGTAVSFNVTEYVNSNAGLSFPLELNVTVSSGACDVTTTYTIDQVTCGFIPRGVSPNGDGKNDTFDLTGYGIEGLNIFNRYGTEVYAFSGSYTNQWYGQTDKGDMLPTGTYFYSLRMSDGTTKTGWVYIN